MPNLTSNNVYTAATGTTSTQPFIVQFNDRNPTPQDVNYSIQQPWVNTLTDESWILEAFSTVSGVLQAVWSKTGSGNLALETLTGDTGGPIGADANHNINVVGDGTTIDIVGTPLTHTLTASTGGSVATSYVEDTGTAVPALGVLNVLGGTGIQTSGSGNTITITNTGVSASLTFQEDVGTATPILDVIQIRGGTNVNTAGATNVVTINAPTPTDVATSYVTNSGTAVPAANVLNVLGTGNITTSGAGSTITIASTSQGALQQVRATRSDVVLCADNYPASSSNIAPTSANGTQVFSLSITPFFSSSILQVSCNLVGGSAVVQAVAIMCFFKNASASPFYTTSQTSSNSSQNLLNIYGTAFISAGTTSPITISVNAGTPATLGFILNGYRFSQQIWGGTTVCSLNVIEWGV